MEIEAKKLKVGLKDPLVKIDVNKYSVGMTMKGVGARKSGLGKTSIGSYIKLWEGDTTSDW